MVEHPQADRSPRTGFEKVGANRLSRRGWTVALFLLLLAAYALAGWRGVLAHTEPAEMDTTSYLSAALQIRETGGIVMHLPNLIRGVYTEATQHPLYLLALSPFAETNIRFFVAAKLVSFAIGFVFIAVYFFAVRRLFGTAVAGGAGWLWVMSAGFVTLVTTVACEGLLGVFCIAFWWMLASGRDDRRRWVAAGLFAGLAFLSKSIGIFLLPVFAVSVLWWERRNLKGLLASRAFWGFWAAFTVTALPLFVRNVVVYGSPLYSDSSGVLWIDRWSEFSYERAAEGRFTLANYLSTHSPAQMLQTFWEGIVRRDPQMVADGLKPLPFWRPIPDDFLSGFYHRTAGWQEWWAAAVVFLAGAGWWANRRHAAAVPTLALWVIFGVFVAWYSKIFPNSPPTRLLYPALILVPVYAAAGVKALAGRVPQTAGRGVWISAAALGILIAGLGLHGGEWIRKDVRKSFEFPTAFKLQLAWSQTVPKPGDHVLVSELFSSYLFYFDGRMNRKYLGWPKLDSMEDLVEWVRREKINYLFVDLATALYNPQVFGEYYRIEKPGVLRPLRPLPAVFKPMPKDPRIPPIFDIYAVQTAP